MGKGALVVTDKPGLGPVSTETSSSVTARLITLALIAVGALAWRRVELTPESLWGACYDYPEIEIKSAR